MQLNQAKSEQQQATLQATLEEIVLLLDKHKMLENLAQNEGVGNASLAKDVVHRQNNFALSKKLDNLHPADIAYILESLPLESRHEVWDLVKSDRDGEILLEVSDSVRHTLISDMDAEELLAATELLDTDEIADLAPDLPKDVLYDLLDNLDAQNRARLQSTLAYDDDTVGAIMDYETATIRDDITLEVVLRYMRLLESLPVQTDKLFVVDRNDLLLGVLPLKKLVVSPLDTQVSEVMVIDPVIFYPDDQADETAQAFERYDLVTAPVVNIDNQLIGRITVDVVMDFIRDDVESDILSMAGLQEDEDFFASVWSAIKNRWAWLAVNLVTALIASRVIGLFEGSIEKIVALAALMPIVAGFGGNSGNQTITMIVRGMALGQVSSHHMRNLIGKEIGVALINGILWGTVLGVIAYLLYGNVKLGIVMMVAMTLNLVLAAFMGVMIPLVMEKLGRDPAVGSSVLITAVTDSGGFFIFLGIATLFLL